LRFWQDCRRPGPNTRSSLENGVTFTSLLLPRSQALDRNSALSAH
jgi:hypothetical protein